MGVRSKRLFGPVGVGDAGATLYTCPAGETALIKHLAIYNQSAAAAPFYLYIDAYGSGAAIHAEVAPGQLAIQMTELFWVLHPGQELLAYVGGGDSMTMTGFGAELEGVAD